MALSANEQTVANFLAGKGLNAVAIAAIMGNLKIESGDSPTAYNANEGAIGLAQWEGGRRTGLQNLARQMGSSETDINVQLNYLWLELTSAPYASVYNGLKNATDVSSAAALWDSGFEKSAGTSRTQRVAAAQSYYGGNGAALTAQGSGTAITTPASGTSGGETAEDFEAGSPWGAFMTTNPELNGILQQAVAGQWTSAKFENAIEASNWYRTNSDTVKQNIALQTNDPAQWQQNLNNEIQLVTQIRGTLGVALTPDQIQQIANVALMSGWSTATLQGVVANSWTQDNANATPTGQAASIQQQLQQTAADYGIPLSSATMTQWTQNILNGWNSADGFTSYAQGVAKSMYPGLAAQIDQGMTVKTIADPYVQTMANLLEVDPSTLSVNTPLIAKALQGTASSSGGAQSATSAQPVSATPLWQFSQQVRQDPSWQYTTNAKQSTAAMLSQLGQDWGFGAGVSSGQGIAAGTASATAGAH